MFNEKIESIKKQTTHTIMGAYISGVAKDTAYISKDTSLKTLGESFCNFGTEVDLVQNDLVDLSKINTAPKAGGVVSNLIRQSNNKIDGYARNIKTLNLPLAESTELLKEYANKIQKAAINIAFAEGAEDDELKQDIRVLLKEGKDEFIKREQEEQAEEEATLEDEQAPEFEDDTDYTELEEPEDEEGLEEEQSEEGFEDAGDEEGFVDEDGNPIEEFADPEGDDEFSDEIPSGKFESNIYDTTGLEAHGEASIKHAGNFFVDYDKLVDDGYELLEKELDIHHNDIRNNRSTFAKKLTQFFYRLTNLNFVKAVGKIDPNTLEVSFRKNDFDGITKNMDIILFKNSKSAYYWNYIFTVYATCVSLLFTPAFLISRPFYFWLTKKNVWEAGIFRIFDSIEKKYMDTTAQKLACEHLKETLVDLIGQAKAKKDEKRLEQWTKAVDAIDEHHATLEKQVNELKEKIKAKNEKIVIAESFNLPVELMNDEKAFNKALNDRNLLKSYSEDYRYLYNGELISVTPFEMDKMKKDLLAIEKSSVQALGESAGISNVLESDELQLAHKATVNELAVVMVARNRFGL